MATTTTQDTYSHTSRRVDESDVDNDDDKLLRSSGIFSISTMSFNLRMAI
jgi:hypothetical protein